MKTKADRIKFVRKLHDLSQEKFTETLGEINGVRITRGAVGNWELGKGIKQENLEQISTKFDVSLDWLSANRGPPPSLPYDLPSESTGDEGLRPSSMNATFQNNRLVSKAQFGLN